MFLSVFLFFLVVAFFVVASLFLSNENYEKSVTHPNSRKTHLINSGYVPELSVEQLFDKAIQEKRQGDFEASIRTYWQLMTKDPDLPMVYYSMAKAKYLAKHLDAKTYYLITLQKMITMHVLSDMEKEGKNSIFRRDTILGQDYNIFLLRAMPTAFPNLLRHLGHAILDISCQTELIDFVYRNNPIHLTKKQSQELVQSYIETYRFRLAGGRLEYNAFMDKYQFNVEQFMDDFYRQSGEIFALEKIDWLDLDVKIKQLDLEAKIPKVFVKSNKFPSE